MIKTAGNQAVQNISESREEIIIMAKTVNGTVKWFSARKGYGFITDAEGVDYFAHFSQIQQDGFRKLTAGQTVEFEIGDDGNGRSLAVNIVPLDGGEPVTQEE